MAQPVHFTATVEHVDRHDQDVCSYRMKSDKRLPRFVPGQFIHLAIDPYDPSSFWPTSRAFSVANSVADRRTIRLTISRQGAFTNRILNEIVPGSVIWGKGPYGEFSLYETRRDRTAVLIAGGTGVTPFASYMDAAVAQGALPARQAILHYGARTAELLVYRALADRCAAAAPDFKARYYAQHVDSNEDPNIERGMLDIDRIVSETPNPSEAVFYISGPRAMIHAFQERLTGTHGIPADQVLVDAWD